MLDCKTGLFHADVIFKTSLFLLQATVFISNVSIEMCMEKEEIISNYLISQSYRKTVFKKFQFSTSITIGDLPNYHGNKLK